MRQFIKRITNIFIYIYTHTHTYIYIYIYMKNISVKSLKELCLTLCDPTRLQYARLPCPSPTPRACSYSCPLSWWCHPTISSSVVPFSSCLQCFLASGSFLMSQYFMKYTEALVLCSYIYMKKMLNLQCSQRSKKKIRLGQSQIMVSQDPFFCFSLVIRTLMCSFPS